jgi:hypothetical protein
MNFLKSSLIYKLFFIIKEDFYQFFHFRKKCSIYLFLILIKIIQTNKKTNKLKNFNFNFFYLSLKYVSNSIIKYNF